MFGGEYPVLTRSVLFNRENTVKEELGVINDKIVMKSDNSHLYGHPVKIMTLS